MGLSDLGRCIMHILGMHDAHGGWWGYIVRPYNPLSRAWHGVLVRCARCVRSIVLAIGTLDLAWDVGSRWPRSQMGGRAGCCRSGPPQGGDKALIYPEDRSVLPR